ncbi:MAG: tetratricopeptide repeat protein [Gammaproteobacteria bacterium]|nr:tetratricopeptide repeat protein [Gammaproteobacteria bacterium]
MDARPNVFEVALESFPSDVVAGSRVVPAILLFWPDQVPPAAETRRTLENLATQYQGKFALALSDVATTPQLAQQLRVQGIPSIRVIVDGQIADQLEGPQGEAVLRQLIEGMTMSDAERLKDQLARFTAARDWEGALQVLKAALQAEPNNPAFKVEWADVLVHRGDFDDAERVLASIAEETPERERPAMRLELAREAASLDGAAALSRVAADGNDLDARYEAAIAQAVAGDYEEALDQCMAILQTDRKFRDDAGRTTMIRIMATMGKGSDVAQRYRRRMFAFLH